jgi:excisionase family DNA binding protein
VRDQYSTTEVGQLVGRSTSSIRTMISRGELEAERLPGVGYRIPRAAVLKLASQVVRVKAGERLSAEEIERLVDGVLEHNEAAAKPA